MCKKFFILAVLIPIVFFFPSAVFAAEEDSQAEIAVKLANPIANMISLPLNLYGDPRAGLGGDGSSLTLSVRPVVPFKWNKDWLVISRTIIPMISQQNLTLGSGIQQGLGDINQSFFFSPANLDPHFIWGVGPVFLLPTASDQLLGSGKWGVGPTFVCLSQDGPNTLGFLTNQIWSFAGDTGRSNINALFLEPFYAYIFKKTYTTITLMSESTYDWIGQRWSVPLELSVSQMFKAGDLPASAMAGFEYWAVQPTYTSKWTWKAGVTLVFLK